jgi:hypothetical protein
MLAVAVAGILAVSATALVVRDPGRGAGSGLSPGAAASEYAQETRDLAARGLVLAPGWRWPADGPVFQAAGPDGAPMTYERGYGTVRADVYWFSSWARRAVTVGDTVQRRRAIARLLHVRETLFYKKRLPQDRALTDRMLELAQRGVMGPLRQWVRANAPAPD